MGLWERISGLAGGIRERIKGLGARAGEFVRAYRIPVTLILGGTLVLLVLIILGVVLGNGWLGAGRAGSGALSGANV
ncbi:MAG: hypothetical protein LBT11_02900, partial [Treponema sp.]|nr:hypothetical protein [Treponema sp.]